jgi:hypothetical protein
MGGRAASVFAQLRTGVRRFRYRKMPMLQTRVMAADGSVATVTARQAKHASLSSYRTTPTTPIAHPAGAGIASADSRELVSVTTPGTSVPRTSDFVRELVLRLL